MTDEIRIAFAWREHGEGLPLPTQQSAGAAGMDLYAALDPDGPVTLLPAKRTLVPCGFSIGLPEGYEAQIRPRSGLAARHGVTVLNTPGTVDADYRGEIMVILINLGDEPFTISRGDRIAQMIISPVCPVMLDVKLDLTETKRGENGLGSTGR